MSNEDILTIKQIHIKSINQIQKRFHFGSNRSNKEDIQNDYSKFFPSTKIEHFK